MQSAYEKLIARAKAMERKFLDENRAEKPNIKRRSYYYNRVIRLRRKARNLTLDAVNRKPVPAQSIMYAVIFVVCIGMCVSCIVTLLFK